MGRRSADVRLSVMMLGGMDIAGLRHVAAARQHYRARQRPLGLRAGSTENRHARSHAPANLVDRERDPIDRQKAAEAVTV
jgi:hypothetical protein